MHAATYRRALIRIVLVAAAGVLLCTRPAAADTCTVSASGLVFGAYDVFGVAPVDSTATVTYGCTGGGKQSIAISLVPARTGGVPALSKGTERLYYNLFQNAARTVVWGDGTGGSQVYLAERSKDPVSVPIFGRIPPGQDVSVGTYLGTVTVEINF
jgi:spore coat protein U-like protein